MHMTLFDFSRGVNEILTNIVWRVKGSFPINKCPKTERTKSVHWCRFDKMTHNHDELLDKQKFLKLCVHVNVSWSFIWSIICLLLFFESVF